MKKPKSQQTYNLFQPLVGSVAEAKPVKIAQIPSKLPRLISNSGGATSGWMTYRELEKGLSSEDFICFANTGKEREETLVFLHEQEKAWGVKIRWLEYCRFNGWKEVNFQTAARNGEPFHEMFTRKNFLPNIKTRWCTQELKIRVLNKFMRSQGFGEWENLVGLRYDEPRRVANNKAGKGRQRWWTSYPLFDARLSVADVREFWDKQNFRLQLQSHEGNCDLCFMKGRNKLLSILAKDPDRAIWWIEMEEAARAPFSKRNKMEDLRERAVGQGSLYDFETTDSEEMDCSCTD